jgi:tryptophan 2,3-dioxygenase
MRYVATVEAVLEAHLRAAVPDQVVQRLWRQLVVTTNAFASRCVDQRQFPEALELLARASATTDKEGVFERSDALELRAFIHDAYMKVDP